MGKDSCSVKLALDLEGLDAVNAQIKRVKKASRKLDKEIAKLAGMQVTVRVRPERH